MREIALLDAICSGRVTDANGSSATRSASSIFCSSSCSVIVPVVQERELAVGLVELRHREAEDPLRLA